MATSHRTANCPAWSTGRAWPACSFSPTIVVVGSGALLVAAAERQASALGVLHLHLYTPASEGFYERLGWAVIDRVTLPSGTVSVMRQRVSGGIKA